MLAVLLVLAAVFGPRWFEGREADGGGSPVAEKDGGKTGDKLPRPGNKDGIGKLPKEAVVLARADDPDVLTVSQTKEGGGKYQTINAALEQVQRGQTIRVLDKAVYQETLVISSPSRHAGITLEAARGATIEMTAGGKMILIDGVPGITLRGFRLHANGTRGDGVNLPSLVVAKNACRGLLLDRLVLEASRGGVYFGIDVMDVTDSGTKSAPAVVRDCLLRQPAVGIRVNGVEANYRTPRPVTGVVLRNNVIEGGSQAIVLRGAVRHVHIVGNRIWRADISGLHLEQLLPGTSDVLVANNTLFECSCGFRLWDTVARGEGVQVRNNLFLSSKLTDMLFLDSGGDPNHGKGAGDGKSVLRVWKIGHNVRAGKPAANEELSRAWIPPSAADLPPCSADCVKGDPTDLDNFLRPEKGSPPAEGGAGRTDPWLPSYVGALPPAGVEPWDWDRTWMAQRPGVTCC